MSPSRVLIHLLLLFLIVLMIDGAITESPNDLLTRRARYGDSQGVAIDVEYKNTSAATTNTTRYRTFLDAAMLSSGFAVVAIAFLVGIIRMSRRQTVNYETIV